MRQFLVWATGDWRNALKLVLGLAVAVALVWIWVVSPVTAESEQSPRGVVVPTTNPPSRPPPSPSEVNSSRLTEQLKQRQHEEKRPAPYEAVAMRFAEAFTDTDRTQKKWHDEVSKHVTVELAAALEQTPVDVVPSSRPTSVEPVAVGDVAVQVRIELENGAALLVTVENGLVSDVRPDR